MRAIWSKPDTWKRLLQGLEEKGFGGEQLAEVSKMIDAENSDLFDVLAYITFTLAPMSRSERVESRKDCIFSKYATKEQQFLAFVLDLYVAIGVSELDQVKLPALLNLKYHSVSDEVAELGSVGVIREVFIGFQEHLYSSHID